MKLRNRTVSAEIIPTLKKEVVKHSKTFSDHFTDISPNGTAEAKRTKGAKVIHSNKQIKGTADVDKFKKVKQVIKKTEVSKEILAPNNWEEVLLVLTEYRKDHKAPVDTMGCERVDVPNITAKDARYHILLALMLSSQTKDEITYRAMTWLREANDGQLTPQLVVNMKEEYFHHCIRQVGFHNTKVKFIKAASQILIDKYDGDVPNKIEDLLALPGVGPKMGLLALQCAWNINAGIGVDIHVHRITNRLGWHKTKTPEATRKALEEWLPKEWWKPINPLLVGVGQTLCVAKNPLCYACPITDLCPSFDKKSKPPAEGKPQPKIRGPEFIVDKIGEPCLLMEYDSE